MSQEEKNTVDINFLRFIARKTKFADKAGALTDNDVHIVLEMQKEVINYANEVYLTGRKKLRFNDKDGKEIQVREGGIKEKICPMCGTLFGTAYKNTKYCSDRCRKKALAMHGKKQEQGWLFDGQYKVSSRLYNVLARAGIKTIEELARKSENELWGMRNVGYWTIGEIKSLLEENGYRLAED